MSGSTCANSSGTPAKHLAGARLRLDIRAWYSCPAGQRHQTLRCEPGPNWSGEASLLGCHSATKSWECSLSVVRPRGTYPAHCGQPVTATREWTWACQTCPSSHCQNTALWEPGPICARSRSAFRSGCHWAAMAGCSLTRKRVRRVMGTHNLGGGGEVPFSDLDGSGSPRTVCAGSAGMSPCQRLESVRACVPRGLGRRLGRGPGAGGPRT